MQISKYYSNALIGGLLTGFLYSLYSMLLYIFEVNVLNVMFGILNFLILLGIMIGGMAISSINTRRKLLDNYMSYKQAFIYSLMVGLIAGVVITLYTYLYSSFADFTFLENQIDEFLIKMQERGIPEDALQEVQNQVKLQLSTSPLRKALDSLISTSIIVVILSLITAIFIRRKKEFYFEN